MSDNNKDDLNENISNGYVHEGLQSPSDSFSTSRYGRARKPRFTNGDFYCSDEALSPLLTHDTTSLSPTKKMPPSSPKLYYSDKKIKKPNLHSPIQNSSLCIRPNESSRLDIDEEIENTDSIYHIENDYNSLLKIVSRPSGSPNDSVNGTGSKSQALKTYSNRKKRIIRFDSDEEQDIPNMFPKHESFSWIESVPDDSLIGKDYSTGKPDIKPPNINLINLNTPEEDINLTTVPNKSSATYTDPILNLNKTSETVPSENEEPKEEPVICSDSAETSPIQVQTMKRKGGRKKKLKKVKNGFNINRWSKVKPLTRTAETVKKRGRKKRSEKEKELTESLSEPNDISTPKITDEDDSKKPSDNQTEIKHKKNLQIIENQRFVINVNQEIEVENEDGNLKTFKIGDIIWTKLGKYPFWPAIIVENKEFKSIFQVKKLHRREEKLLSVQFFGDCGRCSWVPSSNSFIFEGRQAFENLAKNIPIHIKRKDPRGWNGFLISKSCLKKWTLAVSEAETLLPKNILDRFEYFDQLVKAKRREKNRKKKNKNQGKTRNLKVGKNKLNTKGSLEIPVGETRKKREMGEERKPETSLEIPMEEIKKKGNKSVEKGENKTVTNTTLDISIEETKKMGNKHLKEENKSDSNISTTSMVIEEKKNESNDKSEWVSINENATEEKLENVPSISDFHTSTPIKTPPDSVPKKLKKKIKKRHRRYPSRSRQSVTRYNSLLVDLEYKKVKETNDDTETQSTDDRDIPSPQSSVQSSESAKKIQSYEPSKRTNLFKGTPKDRICQVCEKPRNAFKCQGTCLQYFHTKCIRNPEKFSRANKYKNYTPLYDSDLTESSSDSEDDLSNIKIEDQKTKITELSLADQIDAKLEEVMKDKINTLRYCEGSTEDSMDSEDQSGSNSPDIPFHITGDSVMEACEKEPQIEFKCRDCLEDRVPACHVCGLYDSENSTRQKCVIYQCGRYFHPECLKGWPQTQWTIPAKVNGRTSTEQIKTLTCPSHVCHTCVSDDPRGLQGRYIKEKLAKCIRCPTSYHVSNFCIPAGTEILSANQIVCPKHFACYKENAKIQNRKSIHHVNASWCFICAVGGSLICCETCPTSFHAECLKISPPDGSYICEECETGRLPLYDEVVWVKLGLYRWWPAKILFPDDVPSNIKAIKHNVGEFAVQFFGSHDYYWVNRGRVFLYQEGDSGQRSGKKSMDAAFIRAIEEAAVAFKNIKLQRETREAESRPSMKPPSYVKIKANRPVGNVKSGESHNSMTPCTCDPTAAEPCGVDSDCLNRIMLTECNPEICPAGKNCCNQAFEKREYPAMVPFRTAGRGWGLKTIDPLVKGQFVIEYVGEIINEEEYQIRVKRMHERKDENYYFLTIDRERMLDAGPKGNVARFMNHSCQPNCVTQKWTVNGDTRVGLFALQDIEPNTELTFNYNLECIGKEKTICKCGAPNCSGFIGDKAKNYDEKEKTEEIKKKKISSAKILKKINAVLCFVCGKKDSDGRCPMKNCLKAYHLACINLNKWPKEAWKCPRHKCSLCFRQKNLKFCEKCTKSYCHLHCDDVLKKIGNEKFVCNEHQIELPEPLVAASSSNQDTKLAPPSSEVSSELPTPKIPKAKRKRRRRHTIQTDEPLKTLNNSNNIIKTKLTRLRALSLRKKSLRKNRAAAIIEKSTSSSSSQENISTEEKPNKANRKRLQLRKYSLPSVKNGVVGSKKNDFKKEIIVHEIKQSSIKLIDCLSKEFEINEGKAFYMNRNIVNAVQENDCKIDSNSVKLENKCETITNETKEPVASEEIKETVGTQAIEESEKSQDVNVSGHEAKKSVKPQEATKLQEVKESVETQETKGATKLQETEEPVVIQAVEKLAKLREVKDSNKSQVGKKSAKSQRAKKPMKSQETKESVELVKINGSTTLQETKDTMESQESKKPSKAQDIKTPTKPQETVEPLEINEPTKAQKTKEPIKPQETQESANAQEESVESQETELEKSSEESEYKETDSSVNHDQNMEKKLSPILGNSIKQSNNLRKRKRKSGAIQKLVDKKIKVDNIINKTKENKEIEQVPTEINENKNEKISSESENNLLVKEENCSPINDSNLVVKKENCTPMNDSNRSPKKRQKRVFEFFEEKITRQKGNDSINSLDPVLVSEDEVEKCTLNEVLTNDNKSDNTNNLNNDKPKKRRNRRKSKNIPQTEEGVDCTVEKPEVSQKVTVDSLEKINGTVEVSFTQVTEDSVQVPQIVTADSLNETINSTVAVNYSQVKKKRRRRTQHEIFLTENSDVGNNNVGDNTSEIKEEKSNQDPIVSPLPCSADNNLNITSEVLTKKQSAATTKNTIKSINESIPKHINSKDLQNIPIVNGNILENSSGSEVVVKRPRGRPKKNASLSLSLNSSCGESPKLLNESLPVYRKKRKFNDNIENTDNKHVKLMNGHGPEKMDNGICSPPLRSSIMDGETKTDFVGNLSLPSDIILKSNECHLPIRKRTGLRSMDFSNTCDNVSV